MFENDQYLADMKEEREEEREELLNMFINSHRADGVPDDQIMQELIKIFHLSPEDAKRYLEKAKE